MFPTSSYDPETLGVLSRVFDEAWIGVQAMVGPMPLDPMACAQSWLNASWPLRPQASAIRGA
jgi:hypothetical protein